LLLLAAGVFILIGVKTDWAKTIDSIRSANLLWVCGAFALMIISHAIRAVRWNMLTEPAGYRLNNRRSFYAVMAGYLVNVATSRGGEVVRCALAAKSEKAPLELLIGTVVTERIIDLFMLLLVCFATLLTQFDLVYGFFNTYVIAPLIRFFNFQNILIFSLLLFLGLVFFFLKRRKKTNVESDDSMEVISTEKGVKGILLRFTGGLKTVFQLKSPVKFLLFSASIWTCYWLSGFCLMQSLEITKHLGIFVGLGLLVFSAVGIAIPLPAGAGVWGALSFGLSTVYGLSAENAETYGIYNLAFSNLMMIFTGAICYILLWFEMQKIEKNAS
jgi:glycosyltransferase 2 family protein